MGHTIHIDPACTQVPARKHATHSAEVLLMLAPRVEIYSTAIRAKGQYSTEQEEDIGLKEFRNELIRCMDWLLEQGVDLINMSVQQQNRGLYWHNAYLDYIIRWNYIAIIASAGNHESSKDGSKVGFPGSALNAITVGATNGDKQVKDYSNYEQNDRLIKPTLSAPVDKIYLEASGETYSGTSAAAPAVAGVVAKLMEEFPNATLAEITAALIAGADTFSDNTWDLYGGAGTVNYPQTQAVMKYIVRLNETATEEKTKVAAQGFSASPGHVFRIVCVAMANSITDETVEQNQDDYIDDQNQTHRSYNDYSVYIFSGISIKAKVRSGRTIQYIAFETVTRLNWFYDAYVYLEVWDIPFNQMGALAIRRAT